MPSGNITFNEENVTAVDELELEVHKETCAKERGSVSQ